MLCALGWRINLKKRAARYSIFNKAGFSVYEKESQTRRRIKITSTDDRTRSPTKYTRYNRQTRFYLRFTSLLSWKYFSECQAGRPDENNARVLSHKSLCLPESLNECECWWGACAMWTHSGHISAAWIGVNCGFLAFRLF